LRTCGCGATPQTVDAAPSPRGMACSLLVRRCSRRRGVADTLCDGASQPRSHTRELPKLSS
ncbi:MAG TPA: hypothetical protein VF988_04180, partial [Verrucomicrobiae bacterium]